MEERRQKYKASQGFDPLEDVNFLSALAGDTVDKPQDKTEAVNEICIDTTTYASQGRGSKDSQGVMSPIQEVASMRIVRPSREPRQLVQSTPSPKVISRQATMP